MYSATTLNLVVCYLVILVMAIVYLHSLVFGHPEIINIKRHRSTGISYLLWASVWVNTALLYHCLSDGVFSISENYGVVLMFFNVGSMCIFGSAIAYARGNNLCIN